MVIYYQDVLVKIGKLYNKEVDECKKDKLGRKMNLLTEWYTNELNQMKQQLEDQF